MRVHSFMCQPVFVLLRLCNISKYHLYLPTWLTFLNWPNPACFCLFLFFFALQRQIYHKLDCKWKNGDVVVLGTQTCVSRMEGVDKSTEPCQHKNFNFIQQIFFLQKPSSKLKLIFAENWNDYLKRRWKRNLVGWSKDEKEFWG